MKQDGRCGRNIQCMVTLGTPGQAHTHTQAEEVTSHLEIAVERRGPRCGRPDGACPANEARRPLLCESWTGLECHQVRRFPVNVFQGKGDLRPRGLGGSLAIEGFEARNWLSRNLS